MSRRARQREDARPWLAGEAPEDDDDTPDEFLDPAWFEVLQQGQQQEQTR